MQSSLPASDLERWTWKIEKGLSHQAPDLSYREKFQNVLKQQAKPIDLRTAGELIGLSDHGFDSFRRSVQRDRACMRWATDGVGQGKRVLFWMPMDIRGPGSAVEQELISANLVDLETNAENKGGVPPRDTHPVRENTKSVQVTPNPLQEQEPELGKSTPLSLIHI